ncbi:hypothetical protein ABH935_002701 [Catenulispora sp. GAS73]|uniref:CU044_2847 family protein n=1 Tax=Catenulispora sp. GAS73 TaxID=3156269 RepID=UPI003512668A
MRSEVRATSTLQARRFESLRPATIARLESALGMLLLSTDGCVLAYGTIIAAPLGISTPFAATAPSPTARSCSLLEPPQWLTEGKHTATQSGTKSNVYLTIREGPARTVDGMDTSIVEVKLPNGTVALVQAVDADALGADEEDGGAEQVKYSELFDFDKLTATLDGVAHAIKSGVEKALPSKTTVELGISLAVKNGVLAALIVDGKAEASLKVTLEWVNDK